VFNLKPVKRYKTLQLFNLRCPHCHSGGVWHNAKLSKAIAEQRSSAELSAICKRDGLEIEYEIKSKTKYFPLTISEEVPKAERVYFSLNDDII
jgi:hypothetical protein